MADRSPSANPFTFTGRWLDDESGLMYYRARPYGPSLGRFVTQDPMGALAAVLDWRKQRKMWTELLAGLDSGSSATMQ